MFENTLLESSSDRIPVLTSRHRAIAMLAGLGGFLTAWKLLPILIFAPNPKILLWQSHLAGIALALHALMVCYVYAAARRLRLGGRGWAAVTFVFSFAGFLAFLVHASLKTGDWKRAAVPIAYILEAVLLGGLVIVPLIRTEALGLGELSRRWVVVPSPPPPPAAPPAARASSRAAPRAEARHEFYAPPRIPVLIDQSPDVPAALELPREGVLGGYSMLGGTEGGVPGGVPLTFMSPLPPPPVRPAKQKPTLIRQGGQVIAARGLFQPRPDYPPLAKMARIQGVVRLEAVISTAGTIQNLKLISGHPLLVPAALDAVARWRYQPTLLNGEPVEVLTEIDVNFHLAD